MHNALHVAIVHSFYDLGEDVEFLIFGYLVEVVIEVVQQVHIHKVGDQADVRIAHEVILKRKGVFMLNFWQNGRFP